MCILDISERSNPQISAFVDKDTFLLIIFVNSYYIILASYVKENAWFLRHLSYQRYLLVECRQNKIKQREKKILSYYSEHIWRDYRRNGHGSQKYSFYQLFIDDGAQRYYHPLTTPIPSPHLWAITLHFQIPTRKYTFK